MKWGRGKGGAIDRASWPARASLTGELAREIGAAPPPARSGPGPQRSQPRPPYASSREKKGKAGKMVTIHSLPPELIHRILSLGFVGDRDAHDYDYHDSKAALVAAALVHRTWTGPAQELLTHDLEYEFDYDEELDAEDGSEEEGEDEGEGEPVGACPAWMRQVGRMPARFTCRRFALECDRIRPVVAILARARPGCVHELDVGFEGDLPAEFFSLPALSGKSWGGGGGGVGLESRVGLTVLCVGVQSWSRSLWEESRAFARSKSGRPTSDRSPSTPTEPSGPAACSPAWPRPSPRLSSTSRPARPSPRSSQPRRTCRTSPPSRSRSRTTRSATSKTAPTLPRPPSPSSPAGSPRSATWTSRRAPRAGCRTSSRSLRRPRACASCAHLCAFRRTWMGLKVPGGRAGGRDGAVGWACGGLRQVPAGGTA